MFDHNSVPYHQKSRTIGTQEREPLGDTSKDVAGQSGPVKHMRHSERMTMQNIDLEV